MIILTIGVLVVAVAALTAVVYLWRMQDRTASLLDRLVRSLQEAGFSVRNYRSKSPRQTVPVTPAVRTLAEPSPAAQSASGLPTDAPALEDGTLVWDWLVHNVPDPNVTLQSVVTEFYKRAAEDPLVGPYLRGIDTETLAKKFHATVVIVLKQGVNENSARTLAEKHSKVFNDRWEPITFAVFDRTIGILANVLAEAGVPAPAIAAIADTVAPLRKLLAVEYA